MEDPDHLIPSSRGRLSPAEMFPAGDSRFRTRYVELPSGLRIRTVECGDPSSSNVVICVHGWACSAYSFNIVLPLLAAEGCRAVAVDLAGHGLSSKPSGASEYTLGALVESLRQTFDALGVERAVVVGHSMGGAIVARFAALHPERVTGLLLLAAVGFGETLPLSVIIACTPPVLAPVLPYLTPRWLFAFVVRWAYGALGRPSDRDVDEYWAPTQFPEFIEAMRVLLHTFMWSAGEGMGLETIAVPAAVIHGGRDHFAIRHSARRYAELIRGAQFVCVQEAGHLIPQEVPEVVVRTLLDLVSK